MTIVAALVLTATLWIPVFMQSPAQTSDKKGLANTLHSGEHPADAQVIGASWQYFWWNQAPVADGIESVPMISTPSEIGVTVTGNSQWLMGFNEPDIETQANVAPEVAAQLWRTIEVSHADKLLVSPAPVFMEDWLDLFREHHLSAFGQYPRLDGIAVHCYRPTASDCAEWVGRFIDKARTWGIGQVWVTEFAFADPSETEAFVRWMESEPMIARYAIFVNRPDAGMWRQYALLDERGALTDIGQRYSNLP